MAIWKEIPPYPDNFASTCGRVRRDGLPERYTIRPKGRRAIGLRIGVRRFHAFTVARLVLMAHDRMPERGEVARHLNGICTDDRFENLAWGSQYDNLVIDGRRLGERPVQDVYRISPEIVEAARRSRLHPIDTAKKLGISVSSVHRFLAMSAAEVRSDIASREKYGVRS